MPTFEIHEGAKIYTELNTSYIPGDDITIIWQDVYLYKDGEGEQHLMRNLIGWHYGETNDVEVKEYGNAPLTATYF